MTFTPAHRGGSGRPLVCLHGFTDTWRTWELVLPELERRHDVLALTLPGHAGGPPLDEATDTAVADTVERALDDAGFERAHLVGNSMGAYLALLLAERDRAESVVAFAPTGGWAFGDESYREALAFFGATYERVQEAAPQADAIASSPNGKRHWTEFITTRYDRPLRSRRAPDRRCGAVQRHPGADRSFPSRRLECRSREDSSARSRIIWGTGDRLLAWPRAAVRYREQLPNAEWVVFERRPLPTTGRPARGGAGDPRAHRSMTERAVILVEGVSDRIALETLAARRGRDLAAEGVECRGYRRRPGGRACRSRGSATSASPGSTT